MIQCCNIQHETLNLFFRKEAKLKWKELYGMAKSYNTNSIYDSRTIEFSIYDYWSI